MKPNLMISIKIAEIYPEKCFSIAIWDRDIKKWGAAIIEVTTKKYEEETFKKGEYPVIYSTDNYQWDNEADALFEMDTIVEDVLKVIQVMSN